MRKSLVFAVVVVALFATMAAAQVAEQDLYTVKEGDNLYTLEGDYSGQPLQWSRIVKKNPFLNDPGRVWIDEQNRTIVLIKPGEQLQGLKELGIIPNPFQLGRLKIEAPTEATITPPATESGIPWWMWLALVLVVVLGACVLLYVRMTRNPVTAGPPMTPASVTDEEVASRFAQNLSSDPTSVRVKDAVKGRAHGLVQISYADGTSKRLILRGEVAYRAMVSRNGDDGPWAQEYMLQGCGNDLKASGARYVPGLGFRFVPTGVVETEAVPQPAAPVPIANTPETTPAATKTAQPAVKGEKKFTFRPAVNDRPNFIESTGFVSFDLSMKDGVTVIRFS